MCSLWFECANTIYKCAHLTHTTDALQPLGEFLNIYIFGTCSSLLTKCSEFKLKKFNKCSTYKTTTHVFHKHHKNCECCPVSLLIVTMAVMNSGSPFVKIVISAFVITKHSAECTYTQSHNAGWDWHFQRIRRVGRVSPY